MVFFTLAIGEVYHLNTEDYEITIKERLFIYVIVFAEMMAKLFLWGYFAQLSHSKGVWILFILEIIGGFLLEVSY